jgi:hypothetical protein
MILIAHDLRSLIVRAGFSHEEVQYQTVSIATTLEKFVIDFNRLVESSVIKVAQIANGCFEARGWDSGSSDYVSYWHISVEPIAAPNVCSQR